MGTIKLARTLMAVALGVCSGMPLLAQSVYQENQDKLQRDTLLNACQQNSSFADSHADLCRAAKMATPRDEAPPQSLLDSFEAGEKGFCKFNEPSNPDCVQQHITSAKYRRLQFLIPSGHWPDNADYGWLAEFNVGDCEAKAACDVILFVPAMKGPFGAADPNNYEPVLSYLAAEQTVEEARQLKNGWSCPLEYRGNLESITSASTLGASLSTNYSAEAYIVNGHTWQYDPAGGSYYDYDEHQEKAAEAEKKQDQEEQARAQRNSEWLRKVVLALPVHYGESQAATKQVLQLNHYNLSVTGTLWACQSGWQITNSDILARQGVVQDLLTTCLTDYKQGDKEVELALEFEQAQRKRNPDLGMLYEVPTDRLTMAIFIYQGKEVADSLVKSFKRMSPHDCKIENEENNGYGNNEECIPF